MTDIFRCLLVAGAQSEVEIVIQLIVVTQVQSAILRPFSSTK